MINDGVYGYSHTTRLCPDCNKAYSANVYDPNLYCPQCRARRYRREENEPKTI